MKKRILGLILAVIACLTLCIPAIAAEIESDDYGTIPMVDVDSSTENNSMDELNDAGESYPNIEQLNEIYNDSDSTMLDFICVTNPELFSELTEEGRIAFASMNYQDVLDGMYSPSYARLGAWGGSCAVGLRFGGAPILYYSMFFLSVTEGDWPYGRKCKLLVGTSQVIDCETNEVIAYQVETDTDADFLSISEDSVTDIKSNCDYKNDVLVYGNDPSGEFFAFNFSNRDTSPNYGS